jgi:hypothetical protein
MIGFLFAPVLSPCGELAREKNLKLRIFRQGAKFGFGNSGIGVGMTLFRWLFH